MNSPFKFGKSIKINKIKGNKGKTLIFNSKKILKKRRVSNTKFEGSGMDILFGLIYLTNKFKNLDIPISFKTKLGYKRGDFMDIGIRFECNIGERKQKIYYPVKTKEFYNLIKNSKKRFLALFVYIKWKCDSNTAHFNMLIFDTKNKTMERFEPYTKFRKEPLQNVISSLDTVLSVDIKKYLKYKYIIPNQFCPRQGFQYKEEDSLRSINNLGGKTVGNVQKGSDPGGFCGAWSLYFLDLRLSFPDYDTQKLMKKAFDFLDGDKHSFRSFIRNYSNFITDQKGKLLHIYDENSNADEYDIKTLVEHKFSEMIHRK
jgi:hypothetical protein